MKGSGSRSRPEQMITDPDPEGSNTRTLERIIGKVNVCWINEGEQSCKAIKRWNGLMWWPDDHLAGVELLPGEERAEDDLAQDLHRLVQAAAVHARGVQEGVPKIQILLCTFLGVFRIQGNLVRIRILIRIHGSMPLTNGSGSGSCYFRHWLSRGQQKTNFLCEVFLLITFWRCKVFLTIFAWWYEKDPDPESNPDPYLWLVDPHPGGPKTWGSGSGILLFM